MDDRLANYPGQYGEMDRVDYDPFECSFRGRMEFNPWNTHLFLMRHLTIRQLEPGSPCTSGFEPMSEPLSRMAGSQEEQI